MLSSKKAEVAKKTNPSKLRYPAKEWLDERLPIIDVWVDPKDFKRSFLVHGRKLEHGDPRLFEKTFSIRDVVGMLKDQDKERMEWIKKLGEAA